MTTAAGPRQVRINGLAVRLRGPEDAAVVVSLVHGAMDRSASFGRVTRRITDGGGVLVAAPDRRGYADSLSAGVAGSIRDHAVDLAGVLEVAGERPILVVGHSLGGTIALEAALHTLGERNLVAVGSYESPRPWVPGLDRGEGLEALEIGRTSGAAKAAEHFYKSMVGRKVWDRLSEIVRADRRAEGPALLAELAAVRSPGFSVDAAGIRVPVYSGFGELSAEPMRRAAEDLAREAGVEPVVFPKAGHGAHLSHPDQFSRWILSMLHSTPAAAH